MNNIFESINPPIISASGCWSATEEQVIDLMQSNIGAICLKTCTLFSRDGNQEPTFYRNGDFTFNSKGLPNNGYNYYRNILLKYNIKGNKPFILSLAFENIEKLNIILDDLNSISKKNTFVEINLSCPNIKCNSIIGYNLEQIKFILDGLNINNNNITIGFKLPPYLDKELIKNLCHLLNEYLHLIKFITLCNSIPNTLCLNNDYDAVLTTIVGGMSGKANKFISLGNISIFNNFLNKNIKIIGCGGISSVSDILCYKKLSVNYYQIASCFYDEKNNELNIKNINLMIEEYNYYKHITHLNI